MRFLLAILFLLLIGFVQAQNLVPNHSFEQRTGCPTGEDQVELATGWYKVSENTSTPDYYNACVPGSGYFNVPSNNGYTYQEEFRNCNAYVGLCTWGMQPSWFDYREQIGTQLTQPLTIGQKYYLSFRVVMGGSYAPGYYYESPTNNIGLRFSNVQYSNNNPVPIDNFSHLRSTVIITDTLNWTRISGSIIADSNYQFLMVGNFYDDANTDTLTLTCTECVNWYGYYFVDDICVSTDSTLCNGGIDGLPCSVGIIEKEEELFTLFPNPTTGLINIILKENTPVNLMLYNAMGQMLFSKNYASSNTIQINLPYPQGIYFLRVETLTQTFTKKLIKK